MSKVRTRLVGLCVVLDALRVSRSDCHNASRFRRGFCSLAPCQRCVISKVPSQYWKHESGLWSCTSRVIDEGEKYGESAGKPSSSTFLALSKYPALTLNRSVVHRRLANGPVRE